MTTTFNALANATALQWGVENDYSSIERIKMFIISGRATMIQRRYDQTKIFPQSIIMTLKCRDIIKVDNEECEDCFNLHDIKLWRSKEKIPLPIIVKDDSYFMFVGKGSRSFSSITPEELQDIKYRKFSSNENFYFYTNGYIYFSKSLEDFTARFVPENPLDILKLGECNCGCVEDGELILESSLVEGIAAFLKDKRPLIMNDKTEVTVDGDN